MKQFLFACAFITAGSGSFAQDVATSFTLDEARAYALEHNFEVKNAYLDIELARKQSLEATSMGLPQVSISGSFSNFINLPVQVVGANFINPNAAPGETIAFKAGTDYSSSGTLQASQLLFNGSYIVGLQVSKFFVTVSQNSAQLTEEDILFNVTQAYQVAVIGKENLTFIDSTVNITRGLLEEQRAYLELGMITQEDLDQLEFSLASAEESLISAKLQYDNSLALLKLTMGYPIKSEVGVTETTESLMNRANLKEAISGDLSQNRALLLMDNQKTLAEYNVKNYKMSRYPTLSAVFQHTYNAYRNDFNFFDNLPWYPQTMWGLQLNVPLFTGLNKYALIQQAKIDVMKKDNAIKLMEQNLQMQEIQYQNNLLSAKSKLNLQEHNVALATKIYNNAIVRKEIGNGNSIIISQKYNQLMIAQTQYVASLIDVLNTKLNLDKLYNQILK